MKYLGFKKASDVKRGTRVIATRELRNAQATVPEGRHGKIMHDYNKDGYIWVEFDRCNCCGVSIVMSGIRWTDIRGNGDGQQAES